MIPPEPLLVISTKPLVLVNRIPMPPPPRNTNADLRTFILIDCFGKR